MVGVFVACLSLVCSLALADVLGGWLVSNHLAQTDGISVEIGAIERVLDKYGLPILILLFIAYFLRAAWVRFAPLLEKSIEKQNELTVSLKETTIKQADAAEKMVETTQAIVDNTAKTANRISDVVRMIDDRTKVVHEACSILETMANETLRGNEGALNVVKRSIHRIESFLTNALPPKPKEE